FVREIRYAIRALSRSPGFTAAAVVALALGIGGSSAIFSVLENVVLKPLPVPEPNRLMRLYEVFPGDKNDSWSTLDYLDMAKENAGFESVVSIRPMRVSMTGRSGPLTLPAAKVNSTFFATVKVNPALGRGLASDEDLEGGPHSVVIADNLWRREFGTDPRILGQSVTLDGRVYTIVGVMPPGFTLPILKGAEALIPFAYSKEDLQNRGMHGYHALGRLKPGVMLGQANADLDLKGRLIASRLPQHVGMTMRAVPLLGDIVGPVKPVLEALLGAVIMVLLIACANVASMLLARGAARQRELAIRAALGSGRARIVRQLLTEAVLLALGGGALGVLLAAWGVDALVAVAPKTIPRLDEVRLDGAVVGFALAISLVSGVIAGVMPAIHATHTDLVDALKNGAAGATARGRLRAALVVTEVALALVLVIGAGLMIRTLTRLLDVPTGMADPAHVLVADVDLPADKYMKDEEILAFQRRLLPRLAALPGVKSAALVSAIPLSNGPQAVLGFSISGEPAPVPGSEPEAEIIWSTPGYLSAVGIPLLRGRDLTAADSEKAPKAVLVNEAFSRKYLGGRDPIGRHILQMQNDKDDREIVGVIGDVHTQALDRAPEPLMVVPNAQWTVRWMRATVRTASPRPIDLAPLVRTEVMAIDKDQPVTNPRTLEQIVADSVGQRRFQMFLLTLFGSVALLLAALGIYGVMAYSVAQRSREIGIRMALGAQSSQVLRMVVSGGLRLAVLGVGIGVVGAIAVTQALKAALYQVSATDPITFVAVSALLIGVAALASWAPARRAAKVDPMVPLRAE
ncbi:MAG: ABC transporter permease, partial [Myxococcales bacterium]|nr:ABC transporter permease [Myxococcales bacterium]